MRTFSWRAERFVSSACGNHALTSFSGAIDGRPSGAEAAADYRDMAAGTACASRRITRSGCPGGTRSSTSTDADRLPFRVQLADRARRRSRPATHQTR